MTATEIMLIDPGTVVVSDRLRGVDDAWVEAIADSIKANGQSTQIQVRRTPEWDLHLVAGAHRLAACQRLGIKIRAEIIECTELEARLIEIDENLFRRELNPLDRAIFLAERKAIYLELYPETKRGGKNQHTKNNLLNDKMSFSEQTAEQINMSVRSIERAVKIADHIPADVRKRLIGTPLAEKQSDLLYLAGLEASVQRRAVTLVCDGEVKTLRAAVARIEGREAPEASPDERHFARLVDQWGRSSKAAKVQFIQHLRDIGDLDG